MMKTDKQLTTDRREFRRRSKESSRARNGELRGEKQWLRGEKKNN